MQMQDFYCKDTAPLGSPGFAAPEQYGRAQTTPRSDIYGLGATLYFLLTGYDPATTPFHLPPIRSLRPSLPESLALLLTSMLEFDPDARPSSIVAVQRELYRSIHLAQPVRISTALSQSQRVSSPAVLRWLKHLFSP